MDEDYREFAPDDRPDVAVLVGGTWWPGELQAWARIDSAWFGHVTYRVGVAQQHRDTVAADRIRLVDEP